MVAVDSTRHSIDPAVARLFACTFPGVELLFFQARRKDPWPNGWTRDTHSLVFEGPVRRLLDLGLVSVDLIAPKPKRIATGGTYSDPTGWWSTERRRGDRLWVSRELGEQFDRAHPLAIFGPWHWPITDATVRPTLRVIEGGRGALA